MKKLVWILIAILIALIISYASSSTEKHNSLDKSSIDALRKAIAEGRVVRVSPPGEKGMIVYKILPEAPPIFEDSLVNDESTATKQSNNTGKSVKEIYYEESHSESVAKAVEESERWQLEMRVNYLESELGVHSGQYSNSKDELEMRIYQMEESLGINSFYESPPLDWRAVGRESHYTLEELNQRASDLQRELQRQEMKELLER